jgi:hypothetical protein
MWKILQTQDLRIVILVHQERSKLFCEILETLKQICFITESIIQKTYLSTALM